MTTIAKTDWSINDSLYNFGSFLMEASGVLAKSGKPLYSTSFLKNDKFFNQLHDMASGLRNYVLNMEQGYGSTAEQQKYNATETMKKVDVLHKNSQSYKANADKMAARIVKDGKF